ncbi:MAG TPA: hypothetical protein V6C65_09130 [Allocoleopsis sp.]
MMTKLIALLIAITCGLQSTLLISRLFFWTSDALAHQSTTETLGATIHLDPNDTPQAGQASLTWFLLTQPNGVLVTPESCNCQVAVYDSDNQQIIQDLPLSTITLIGHQQSGNQQTGRQQSGRQQSGNQQTGYQQTGYQQTNHRAISTSIIFPVSGNYTVVLSGQSTDNSFEPFALEFPVLVYP